MSLSSGSSTCSSSDLIQTLSSIDGNERRRRSKRKSKVLQTQSEEIVRKCLWLKCSYETTDATQIIEHIKSKHIFTQKSLKTFKCLWKGCRVYKAQSCSFNWLERHSITHVDNKPFACIINDCSRKFQTQASLERHVNSHMNVYESSSSPTKNTSVNNLSASLSTSNLQSTSLLTCNNNNGLNRNNSLSKLPKKRRVVENGNCKNFRKAQYKDFIDEFSYKLIKTNLETMDFDSDEIKLKAELVAFKQVNDKNLYLVEWHPRNIVDNEWTEESKLTTSKTIPISMLKTSSTKTNSLFYNRLRFRASKRK